ncbi:MAG: hypothetical protein ORN54_09580 [Cyclobacteriaceae bacterium]|nr:hypothetical protein [Cyclobacteriaceae bacterium]
MLLSTKKEFSGEALTQGAIAKRVSRPEIGLHQLTCKQDEKIRKNSSGTSGWIASILFSTSDFNLPTISRDIQSPPPEVS